jgi:phage terminase large subunit GpA-like protein
MISGIEDWSAVRSSRSDRPPYMTGIEMRRMARDAIRRLCEPQEEISVTDFSARHRILPETSTSPGPYDPDRRAFARRPLDLMGSVDIPMVVLCWASQLTKSTLIENALMYRIKRMPSPIVVVQPKIDAAEQWAKERFRPMIRATPLLKKLIKTGSQRSRRCATTSSPAASRSSRRPRRRRSSRAIDSPFQFLDEVDRMENIVGEGNPVEIVLRRQGAADIGLAVLTSTPRDADSTIIWPYLEAGRTSSSSAVPALREPAAADLEEPALGSRTSSTRTTSATRRERRWLRRRDRGEIQARDAEPAAMGRHESRGRVSELPPQRALFAVREIEAGASLAQSGIARRASRPISRSSSTPAWRAVGRHEGSHAIRTR